MTRLGPGPEFDLVRRLIPRDAAHVPGVRIGPGDDCAVVAGEAIAVTVDMAMEDVHFRRAWLDPEEIGYRTAAAAISDLAAMAARPIGVLASLGLAEGDEEAVGERLAAGIAAAAEAVGAAVLGGDLVRSPGPLVIDIAALGEARDPVRRSAAEPGHQVWVTGRLGAAAAAVRAWLAGATPDADARRAFVRPVPRTREAMWLHARGVLGALIDLSDGLAGDAAHLAAASGVRILLRSDALPVAPAAAGPDGIRLAAAGGDDYELCFTAPAGAVEACSQEFVQRFSLQLTRVGEVREGDGVVIVDAEGSEMELEAFQHWRTKP